METFQEKMLLLFNNIPGIRTILQPWVRRWAPAESQIDTVSTFRKPNMHQITPELNAKWHLSSILKEKCTRLWFEDSQDGI